MHVINLYLNVDEQALDWPERIVYGEVEVEFPHEKQFVVQDYVHGTLLVTFDVGDELIDGNVELFHFARKVCRRHPKDHLDNHDKTENTLSGTAIADFLQYLLRMEVHDRVVEVESLEVL